jgi:hypothetical protein
VRRLACEQTPVHVEQRIRPLPAEDKGVYLPNWSNLDENDNQCGIQPTVEDIDVWSVEYPHWQSTSVRCGEVVAIDCDVFDKARPRIVPVERSMTLSKTAADCGSSGSVVVAAVMFPFRGTDYGTTASPAKTGVRHQRKGTHGAEHDRRGRRLDQIRRRAQEVQAIIQSTQLISAFSRTGRGTILWRGLHEADYFVENTLAEQAHCVGDRYSRMLSDQPALIPANLITLAHFSVPLR